MVERFLSQPDTFQHFPGGASLMIRHAIGRFRKYSSNTGNGLDMMSQEHMCGNAGGVSDLPSSVCMYASCGAPIEHQKLNRSLNSHIVFITAYVSQDRLFAIHGAMLLCSKALEWCQSTTPKYKWNVLNKHRSCPLQSFV